jgi:NAD(P)-dependent dehydrogenase (short-subunit alcohol dehydrogenase family)
MSIRADPTEFAGKRVLVSGGTKGLGRATVELRSRYVPALKRVARDLGMVAFGP